jgi:hypothetical protein
MDRQSVNRMRNITAQNEIIPLIGQITSEIVMKRLKDISLAIINDNSATAILYRSSMYFIDLLDCT